MRAAEDFLGDHPAPRPWQLPDGGREGVFEAGNLFLGRGDLGLEVVVASAQRRPNVSDIRQLWKRRRGGRAAPVLLVVLYPGGDGLRAAACGPVGEDAPVLTDCDPGSIERIAATALEEPDRQAAIRFLQGALSAAESSLPGLRNAGMFSDHVLETDVRERDDWEAMTSWGRDLLKLQGRHLIEGLGFDVDGLGAAASVLRVRKTEVRSAVAVFLEEQETPDGSYERFGGTTPVSYALAMADREQLPYVVITRGKQVRVYAATRHTGVGRKGRAETFVEANLALLPDDQAGFLPLIFGAPALEPDGSFGELLDLSTRYSTALGERLRDRVYEEVVPSLARVVADHHVRTGGEVTEDDLDDLYETAMVILFRILFVAYAEDKDLLPYRSNGLYQRVALKSLARDLAERSNSGDLEFDAGATSLWSQLRSLWRAVATGNRDWDIPPYDGGMFSDDREVSPAGARIAELEATNAEIGPALFAMLVDEDDEGVRGPIDFRSLSVREFGTIYEGLLESSLAVAATDLTIVEDQYLPAKKGDPVDVRAGEIYLHDRSGARKSTGSYFTKPFAVEHLLDHALDPAIDDHLERVRGHLAEGEEAQAAQELFDFRVADIAMGSGHFLVAAIDHIEQRFSDFLAENPIPHVSAELQRLRSIALENLGEVAGAYEIEDASLLRRLIARRCIYGVDLNLIAVELARLAIWIHTFVPGLPLSFLDHNLVEGNSLTGIGTIDEALDILVPDTGKGGTPSIFREQIEAWLDEAAEPLRRLGRLADATLAEVEEARQAHDEATQAVERVRDLFDLLIAIRLGEATRIEDISDDTVADHPQLEEAFILGEDLKSLHFPVKFPEVFLRDRSGFDCILGNPPWEEATVEELGFWAARFPGLIGMPQGEAMRRVEALRRDRPELHLDFEAAAEQAAVVRKVLVSGPFPGMGTGDPDLYKAFCWRFWHLVADGGAVGVVLPRSALTSAGTGAWRREILGSGSFNDVAVLKNAAGWVFDDVTHQYTVALVAIRKGGRHLGQVRFSGPFRSLYSLLDRGSASPSIAVEDFLSWTDHASFPLLPTDESLEVFLKMRRHPRLDANRGGWRVRPVTELHATNDKKLMIFDPETTAGLWPVYKGASFDLWNPDTGKYYGYVDPDHTVEHLYEKRKRQGRNRRSAFSEMPIEWLSDRSTLNCLRPRIAFRDIARGADARTIICALVPPGVVLTNKAPYLLFARGSETHEALLLGVLSSVPLDWFAKRFVELGVNFHIFSALPVPVLDESHVATRIIQISARLAAVDDRYRSWADALRIPVGGVSIAEKDGHLAELDAAVSHLYGLNEEDVIHIFETFHEGWDYTDRLDRVLEHFRRLA